MKIVVHCVYFPPEVGGLESHVHYLCRGLVARGHRVTVVTSLSRPDLAKDEVMDGIRIHRTVLPARNPWGWFVHAAGSTGRTREVARDADVVHAQAFPSLLPCALALAGTDTPLVCTLHTSHFLRLAANPVVRGPLGKLIELSDHNFAASKEIADVGEGLNDSVSVEVVVNGVDTGVFAPVPGSVPRQGGRRRLVVPRRLFPKNGVEFFVRALPAIVAGADVDVIVIGDGPERARLEELAASLRVADRVDFLGARLHAEMPALLSSADLAVFPSLVEATSVAALESMACGLPVAASAVGGLPEIIDDGVGGLFAPGDPEALAARVLELLSSPEGLRERGTRARERVVARWSNERLVDRHLDVYRQLAGGATGIEGSHEPEDLAGPEAPGQGRRERPQHDAALVAARRPFPAGHRGPLR